MVTTATPSWLNIEYCSTRFNEQRMPRSRPERAELLNAVEIVLVLNHFADRINEVPVPESSPGR